MQGMILLDINDSFYYYMYGLHRNKFVIFRDDLNVFISLCILNTL